MSDISPVHDSNAGPEDSPASNHASRAFGVAELVLAGGWLMIPAAQYYGTFQRTGLQIEGAAPSPEFAQMDLMPVYILLVVATFILLLLRNRWQSPPSVPAIQPAAEVTTEALP